MHDTESGGDKTAMSWKKATENIMQNSADVIYIGVYSLDTLEHIAASGSEKIVISKKDMLAIVTHTKTSDNVVAGIKIAGLNFACLSFGSARMTGMSNFNVDNESVEEVDKTLYDLANIRYTRQDSFEAQHMLNISAFLLEDVILVGIAVSTETTSVLKVLEETVSYKKGETVSKTKLEKRISKPSSVVKKGNKQPLVKQAKEASKRSLVIQASDANITPVKTYEELPASEFISKTTSNDDPAESVELKQRPRQQQEGEEVSEIQRRKSTKEEIERRKDQTKRETEFCEDWRTATIRSIEALRNIGPFSEGSSYDDDQRPLISAESVPHSKECPEVSHNLPRRTSRPTMV